jgi:hypothetical protein
MQQVRTIRASGKRKKAAGNMPAARRVKMACEMEMPLRPRIG